MPANLPTYTSQEQLQPAPIMDNSAGWNSLAKVGESVANIGEKGLLISEQSKAEQQKLALDADQQIATADINSQSERIRLQATLSSPFPDKQKESYLSGTTAYFNSLIQNSPTQNHARLMRAAAEAQLSATKEFDNQIIEQNKVTQYVTAEDTLYKNKQNINDAIRSGDPRRMTLAQFQARDAATTALKTGSIKPSRFTQYTQENDQDFSEQAAIQNVDTIFAKGGAPAVDEYRKNVMKVGIPGYTQDQMNAVGHKIDARVNLLSTSKDSIDGRIDLNNETQKKNAKNGFPVDQLKVNAYNDMYPNKAEANNQEINKWQLSVADANAIVSMPFDKQSEALQTLKTQRDADSFENTQRIVKEQAEAWKNDPWIAAMNYPSVQTADTVNKQAATAILQTGASISPSKVTNSDITQANIDVQRAKGINENDLRAMSVPDAEMYSNLLSSANNSQTVRQILTQLKQDKGSNYDLAMKNILSVKNTGLDRGFSFALSLDPSNPGSDNDLKILQTPIDVLKHNRNETDIKTISNTIKGHLGLTSTLWNSGAADEFNDYARNIRKILNPKDAEQKLDDAREFLEKMALGNMSKTSNASKAVDMAFQQTLSSNFAYPRIKGVEVMMPKKYNGKSLDSDQVTIYAKYAQDNLLPNFGYGIPAGNPYDRRLAPTSALSNKEKKDLYEQLYLKHGSWVSNQDFTGLNYVDALGNPVINPNTGAPFGFKYDDIYNIKYQQSNKRGYGVAELVGGNKK